MKRDLIADYTALLASTEIGVGSLIHGFHIPFGGHALSINQGCVLTLFVKKSQSAKDAARGVNLVSLNSAVLKSLAPAGKKLTPMLALVTQGALYSLGLILGRNGLGVTLGMLLLVLWGFAQPLLIYYLFFGQALFDGVIKLWTDLSLSLGLPTQLGVWILLSLVVIKSLTGIILSVFIWTRKSDYEKKYLEAVSTKRLHLRMPSELSPASGALRDVLSPIFLLSLGVSITFLYLSDSQNLWLYVLRPLAVGYLFFWIGRKISGQRVVSGFGSLSAALEKLSHRSRN